MGIIGSSVSWTLYGLLECGLRLVDNRAGSDAVPIVPGATFKNKNKSLQVCLAILVLVSSDLMDVEPFPIQTSGYTLR